MDDKILNGNKFVCFRLTLFKQNCLTCRTHKKNSDHSKLIMESAKWDIGYLDAYVMIPVSDRRSSNFVKLTALNFQLSSVMKTNPTPLS
jgi:hypothetical protein